MFVKVSVLMTDSIRRYEICPFAVNYESVRFYSTGADVIKLFTAVITSLSATGPASQSHRDNKMTYFSKLERFIDTKKCFKRVKKYRQKVS